MINDNSYHHHSYNYYYSHHHHHYHHQVPYISLHIRIITMFEYDTLLPFILCIHPIIK